MCVVQRHIVMVQRQNCGGSRAVVCAIQHRAVPVIDHIERQAHETAENAERHEQHLDAWDVALVVVVLGRNCQREERETDILHGIKTTTTSAIEAFGLGEQKESIASQRRPYLNGCNRSVCTAHMLWLYNVCPNHTTTRVVSPTQCSQSALQHLTPNSHGTDGHSAAANTL